MNSEAAINYISFYILKKMSDADRDEILDSPMGKAKSFVVCPQSMFGEIIGSDDEDWIPPKASYSVIEKLEAAPSQFNHNIVAIDSNFRKVKLFHRPGLRQGAQNRSPSRSCMDQTGRKAV